MNKYSIYERLCEASGILKIETFAKVLWGGTSCYGSIKELEKQQVWTNLYFSLCPSADINHLPTSCSTYIAAGWVYFVKLRTCTPFCAISSGGMR